MYTPHQDFAAVIRITMLPILAGESTSEILLHQDTRSSHMRHNIITLALLLLLLLLLLLALSSIPRALQFAFLVSEMFGCCYWRWHKVDINETIYALFSEFPFALPAWQQQVFLFTLWCKKSWSIWDPPPSERKQKDLQLHRGWKWRGHSQQAHGS
jgi:hypothetical protein